MKTIIHNTLLATVCFVCAAQVMSAERPPFDGLNLSLGNLYRVSPAKSRSISPENFTGEKGKAGMSIDGRQPMQPAI
jgi:hypothetical protein